MSQDVNVTKGTKLCNDLNLHKLLAFASLPVSPALDISEKQSSLASPLSPLISHAHTPPLPQPRAPSSTVSITRNGENTGHVTKTVYSSAAHEGSSILSTPLRTSFQHPVNSRTASQMITPKDVYKMTPAPVFMTPSTSVYPHVTLIPETDLLRSMIVQDVKQVTQKLFDKNSKKKRGRRREKEEIIPGNFGTLKINFTKFVDVKHPPFSLDDPPAPKRTVYQRIAPYPVVTTDSSKVPEKASRKAKGSSTRSFKRHDNAQIELTSGDTALDSTTCSSSRLNRSSIRTRRNRQREARRSLDLPVSHEVPISSVPQLNRLGHDGTGHVITELASFSNIPPDHRSIYASCATAMSSATSAATVTCISANVADSSTDSTPEFQGSDASKQDDVPLIKSTSMLDTNSNCIEASSSFLLANGDASYSELLDSSAAMDSSEPNLGSPGVIGSELSSLLSELCNDFPPLTLANAEENMDVAVVANEAAKQSTATVSVLSQPVTSHRQANCVAGRIDSFAETAANLRNNALDGEYDPSLTTSLPSSPFILETISSMNQAFASTTTTSAQSVSCTTEVLHDSAWEDHNLESQILKECSPASKNKNPDRFLPTGDNLFTMDVDASHCDSQKHLLNIVDISPEYASTEGGGKIILIGSWNSKYARYSCKFGDVCTPCDLIQNGVLRCFCPPHSPGKVDVCVLSDDTIISKSVEIEYVDTEDVDEEIQEGFHGWLNIKDDDLKSLLVERIEAMLDIFDVGNTLPRFQGMIYNSIDIEDTLVSICESMSKVQDLLPVNIDYKSANVMTVLHLSASLGFTKLIQTLCNWVETTSNRIIQEEADPCKYDQFHLTPLMWACAKGKFDSVCVLIQWDESAINLGDKCGCTPLSLSKDQGHTILVRYLEKSQSKGSMSKNSSFASDTGSPNLRSGHLSRSSSLNSQVEWGRELYGGNDDLVLTETSRKSPGSARVSNDGSPDSSNGYLVLSRTLGQTLVHVQAIIQDGADAHNDGQRTALTNIDIDNDSLFTPSPFTPRMHNSIEDRHGNHTPKSLASLSPASPAGSQSPFDPTSKDTAEFCEFFYNSDRILERDFAELTLTDEEQQNLYKAASVIQNAYKRYRERRKQRDIELSAAVLIQSYYRRYKEYAMYKKMQKGALVIQHKYRAHREKKKQKSQAASVIQTYYRRYKERQNQPVAKELIEANAPVQQSHCINAPSSQMRNRPSPLPEWKKNKFISQQRSHECCQEKRIPSTNSIDKP